MQSGIVVDAEHPRDLAGRIARHRVLHLGELFFVLLPCLVNELGVRAHRGDIAALLTSGL